MTSKQLPRALSPILSVKIKEEQDIVTARQRARQLSSFLHFHPQDQSRLATAVSECARNIYQYAGEGAVEFAIDLGASPQVLWVTASDNGPGIPNLDEVLGGAYQSRTGMGIGLIGTRRLMSNFHIESTVGRGTTIRFGKQIPQTPELLTLKDLGSLCERLSQERQGGTFDELQRQNRDLLHALETLRIRETELEQRTNELFRLNLELEETNRGVVALYGELDEKAIALRRADEMKSHFLRHVSHEFRTPLNSILALARILLDRTDGPLEPEQEKQVAYISKAAADLTEMVNDLLDLAKVESGKAELRLAKLEVAQVLGAVRALMRPLVTNDSVRLVFQESSPGLSIETDESKLSQILRNLISNALKFTPAGSVTVSASLSPDGEAIRFIVKDTGIGIAPEDQERIFQEFAQVESPLQRKVKGTGLGLPLSRKLADLLSGTLQVTSQPGSGSTFTLSLPRNRYTAGHPAHAPSVASEHGADTILVIDDDEASRYLTRQMFAGTKYKVIEASGGIEGAELARFQLPVLIMLDLTMPDRSGFEVLDELKTNPSTRHIPVVIQSSRKLGETDLNDRLSQALAVMRKGSTDRSEALLAIREALGQADLFVNEPEFSAPVK